MCARPYVEEYAGGLLGVSAHVRLDRALAHVRLEGLPVGGVLQGTAQFGEENRVVLNYDFERALRRRLCSVEAVERVGKGDAVVVHLRLPVFGSRACRLARITTNAEESKQD